MIYLPTTGDILFDTALILIGGGLSFFLHKNQRNIKSIGLIMKVALLLVTMARHYYDTHPEAKKKIDRKSRHLLERIYDADLKPAVKDKQLKSSKDTGAVG